MNFNLRALNAALLTHPHPWGEIVTPHKVSATLQPHSKAQQLVRHKDSSPPKHAHTHTRTQYQLCDEGSVGAERITAESL